MKRSDEAGTPSIRPGRQPMRTGWIMNGSRRTSRAALWALPMAGVVALAWAGGQPEYPVSFTGGDIELVVPKGEYSAMVVAVRDGPPPQIELRLGEDVFPIAVGADTTVTIPFAQGLRLREEARVVIHRQRGQGEAFAWGITTFGPVVFPPAP